MELALLILTMFAGLAVALGVAMVLIVGALFLLGAL